MGFVPKIKYLVSCIHEIRCLRRKCRNKIQMDSYVFNIQLSAGLPCNLKAPLSIADGGNYLGNHYVGHINCTTSIKHGM